VAKLQGLRELTLKFPLPAKCSYVALSEEAAFFGPHTVHLTPLSQLTNLSKLVVQGIWPQLKAPSPAGAAGANAGASAAAAVKAYGACLPSSLTELIIEGGSGLTQEGGFLLQNWFAQLKGVTQLQQLQLVNIRLDDSEDDGDGIDLFSSHFDFDSLPALRELRFTFAAEDFMGFASGLILPPAMSKLSNLEVLWAGAHESIFPWQQFYWYAETEPLADLLSSCAKLREFGQASDPQWVPAQTERLSIYAPDIDGPLPSFAGYEAFMNIRSSPSSGGAAGTMPDGSQLQHLEIECHGIGEAWVLQLAELTKLTFLHLDSSYAFVNIPNALDGWSDLSLLGKELPLLRRLELICCSASANEPVANNDSDDEEDGSDGNGSEEYPPLILPVGLSSFTQIKELLLGCVVDPDSRQLPKQPKALDFLEALSGLRQLECLELEGYANVSPVVVATLVLGCMPELRKLYVGRCNHPCVAAAAAAAAAAARTDDTQGDLEDRDGLSKALVRLIRYAGLDVQWKELKKMYKRLCPQLDLKVGYAKQWRK
jgi:hypothetical protein